MGKRKSIQAVIENKTDSFMLFHEKSNIKIHEAFEIQKVEAHKDGRVGGLLYIAVNDEYIFSSSHDKLGNVSLRGYYVNSTNGDIRYVDTNETYKLKSINHSDSYPSLSFKIQP